MRHTTDKIIENIGNVLLLPVLDEDDKTWKKFYGIIESGLFDNGSRVHLVCTLTALIDEVNKGVKESDIYEKFFNYEMIKDPYDIEHIEARNNFKDDKENVDKFNGIGNLTVLERSINRGIKDESVGDKTEEYKKSKYAAVEVFVHEFKDKHEGKWDIGCVRKRKEKEIDKIESFMKGELDLCIREESLVVRYR